MQVFLLSHGGSVIIRVVNERGTVMNKHEYDQPINLEESSSTELKRVVIRVDEAEDVLQKPATDLPAHPHAKADRRELLKQPFTKVAAN